MNILEPYDQPIVKLLQNLNLSTAETKSTLNLCLNDVPLEEILDHYIQ